MLFDFRPYTDAVHDCFKPDTDKTYQKPNCKSCFSIAYSLEHETQNGATKMYEYTMHRGCQEDYPDLELADHKPEYGQDDKPKEGSPWSDIELNFENYGTFGAINAKYMTWPTSAGKDRYDSDNTGIEWNLNYGLKESFGAQFYLCRRHFP